MGDYAVRERPILILPFPLKGKGRIAEDHRLSGKHMPSPKTIPGTFLGGRRGAATVTFA
jgi:hypothetical protein